MAAAFPNFSVTTINLRFGLARDKGNRWESRKDVVQTFLDRHHQRFFSASRRSTISRRISWQPQLKGYNHIGRYNPDLPWWQSNLIFFERSWTCLGYRHHFISDFPDIPSKLNGSRWPRQCVMGWFEKDRRHLLVANTHFDFFPAVQARSAGIIMGFTDRFPPGLPMVITGDFNTGHDSSAFRAFEAHGFKEVFENNPPGTYHGFTGETRGRHIDWILYRGGLCPGQARALRFRRDGRYPSDHFPVQAEFSFKIEPPEAI